MCAHSLIFFVDKDNIEGAILRVALEFKWQPTVIGGLFLDSLDVYGLYYWDEMVLEMIRVNEERANELKNMK